MLTTTPPYPASHAAPSHPLLSGYIAHLPHYALLEASGRDASVFLHSQLTQDFQSLPEDRAHLAGLCSVKGRLLADFLGWQASPKVRQEDPLASAQPAHSSILLLLSSDLLSEVIQTLSKFILRRKVVLNEATSKYALIGLVGENPVCSALFPSFPRTRHHIVRSDAGTLICLSSNPPSPIPNPLESTAAHPASTLPKHYLWVVPQTDLQSRLEMLEQHSTCLPSSIWDWLEIQAGQPHITAATQGLFVPQRANLDVLEGIHFKKGCYPGQEVVARLQYRGVIRHRTVLARTKNAQVGQEIFHLKEIASPAIPDTAGAPSDKPEEIPSCGLILSVAPHPSLIETVDCLVMLALATLGTGTLHVGAINGPLLKRLPLPYVLPEESQTPIENTP